MDEVIVLLAGNQKQVFPLEQFFDGRPAEGISDVVEIIGSPRRAWLWLVGESSLLGNKRPIDLLKEGRKATARQVFQL